MRAPAVSPAKPLGRLALTFVALLLATLAMTTPAKADEPSGAADGEAAVVADVAGESAGAEGDAAPAADAAGPEAGAPTLASYLSGGMLRVSADVELVSGDGEAIEPVVGSFTADGLTYAIVGEGQVALVAISPRTLADGLAGGPAASPAAVPSGEGSGSGVPTSPSPSPEGTPSDDAEEGAEAGAAEGLVAPGPDAGADAEGDGEPVALTLPEAVSYDGTGYSLMAIGPRALAGCEADAVVLPASAASVDQAAFEGSSVASVEVAEGNPHLSSFDGMLFDAGLTRLLLIPEGKQGAARVPSTAEEVDAHALSHSGGVASFSVDAGCAAFHSENGCLYDASGNLLWAPPGSEEAASLAASADGASDGLPMASLGTASSAYATRGFLTLDPNGGAFRYNNGDTYGKRTVPMYLGDLIIHTEAYGPEGRVKYYATEADCRNNKRTDAMARRYLHDWNGWTVTAAGTTETVSKTSVGGYKSYSTTPVTVKAQWKKSPVYEVTLDKQEGTGGTDRFYEARHWAFLLDPGHTSEDQKVSSIVPPTRPGHVFKGYYTKADGTGTQCVDADGRIVFAEAPTKDMDFFTRATTIYAKWERDPRHKVSFDPNGGTWSSAISLVATEGQAMPAFTAAKPTRTGHSFQGWYDDRTGGTQYYKADCTSARSYDKTTDTTLYARWTANTYSVALDRTGGTGGTAGPVTATFGQAMPKVEPPTRAGYRFLGYFNAEDVRYYNADGTSARDWDGGVNWTIFAHWEPCVYEVALDKQGGTGGTDRFWLKYAHWASLTEGGPDNCNPLPSLPTRAGYRFAGYYTEPGDRGRQDIGADGRLLILNTAYTSNATLYAHWAPLTLTYQPGSGVATVANAYERAFDASGAGHDRLVGSSSFEGAKGFQAWALWTDSRNFQVFTLPDGNPQHFQQLVPSRAGYRLVGWALNGARLEEGKFVLIHGAATLEPIWEPCIYEVTLDKRGGTGGTDRFWLKYGHWASLTEGGPDDANPLPSLPTRAGYDFMGYYTEPDGRGRQDVGADGRLLILNTAYASNATLYAKWEARTYSVALDRTGGTGGTAGPVTAAFGQAMPKVEPPTRAGYRFLGYFNAEDVRYYNADGTSARDWDGGVNWTIFAHWEPCVYEVALDKQGGTGGTDRFWLKYAHWASLTEGGPDNCNPLPSLPTRAGYRFAGYFTEAGGKGSRHIGPKGELLMGNTAYASNVTLYAHWEPNVYEVTLDKQGGSGGTDRFWLKYGHWASLDPACPEDTGWVFLEPPTREPGYRFAGYWTEPDGKGERHVLADGRMVIARDEYLADATLYAKWEAVPYGISYDCAGGMLPEGARSSYSIEDAFDLPVPARYGYQFDGWDVSGVAEGGAPGPVLGAGVETVTGADGSKVTRVKAGTYGDLSCTARWTLRYDLDVPVCDPGSVTFEADSLTGQVRVAPGTSAEGSILSYMAVPVALDSLSCEGLGADGSPDPAGGAPELEAIFGAGSASKVRFMATLGEGDAARTAKVTAGGSFAIASLAGLSIPAAASHDAPGRIPVAYGLELDSDLAIPPVRDAAPVARLAYTVSLLGAGA